MNMFKLSCLVKDENIGHVMRTLAGHAINLECKPVINAEVSGVAGAASKRKVGRPRGKAPVGQVKALTDGSPSSMILNHLQRSGIKNFSNDDISQFLRSIGVSPKSQFYHTNRLLQTHHIVRLHPGRFALARPNHQAPTPEVPS